MKNEKYLESEYKDVLPVATKFTDELVKQFNELLKSENISISFPIQYRVKTWLSIREKLKRKYLKISSVKELNDLVGLRIILEFKRGVEEVGKIIASNFTILEKQNKYDELKEDQFGYSSDHYVIEVPKSWLVVPTLKPAMNLKAEIQVRTTAQHIWASASHTLQYKKESAIPPSVRRSINRVSALLETVDLEFERVLNERESYIKTKESSFPSEKLNVDLIKQVLDSLLPLKNKTDDENYGRLFDDLKNHNITSRKQLIDLINKNLKAILKIDAEIVKYCNENPKNAEYEIDLERLQKGIFYSHTGLVRSILEIEFSKH
jgi:putative GTP pyrophosphokinase